MLVRGWRQMVATWKNARVAHAALGKYIIVMASVLHLGWAVLLCAFPVTANATPVHVLVSVFGGRYRAAFVLAFVAVLALAYPFVPRPLSNLAMATMLVPQQVVLLMSAGAVLYAVAVQHYADGTAKVWAHILSDQLPMVLLAVLYTIVVLEASSE